MELLTAIQTAESRLDYKFTKEDFSQSKVGAMMIPSDFNFEENVSSTYFTVSEVSGNVTTSNRRVDFTMAKIRREINNDRDDFQNTSSLSDIEQLTDFPPNRGS